MDNFVFDEKRYQKNRKTFLRDITKHLKMHGAYQAIDRHALNRLSDWHGQYLEYKYSVETTGGIFTTKNGYEQKTAAQTNLVMAEKMLQNLYKQFGIDLITRNRLKMEIKKADEHDYLIK